MTPHHVRLGYIREIKRSDMPTPLRRLAWSERIGMYIESEQVKSGDYRDGELYGMFADETQHYYICEHGVCYAIMLTFGPGASLSCLAMVETAVHDMMVDGIPFVDAIRLVWV